MESQEFSANGLAFHVLHWGWRDPGRAMLLLHGLASNARIWEQTAPHLAEAGWAVFAPDLRGHGRSAKPDTGYDIASLTDDIAGLIRSLGVLRPVLVGHSWGAALALAFAARAGPGTEQPAALVLVDGGLGQLNRFPGGTWETVRDLLTPPRLAGMARADLAERLRDPQRKWPMDEQAVDISLANFELRPDGTVTPHLTFERHMRIVRSMWEFEVHAQFVRVRCPILALPARPPRPWDEAEERFVLLKEDGAERAIQVGADLRVHWMDDTIHDVPLQRPRRLAQEILGFADGLTRHVAG
ncbi:MAG: hypothetical protein A2Y93_06405 [Chloroflexi bacterium RBG_13_68_17]|nr:MAG: hypothetical protein A2Y93_06405 [Chloroflexi bacterium RBG_13_68_17]